MQRSKRHGYAVKAQYGVAPVQRLRRRGILPDDVVAARAAMAGASCAFTAACRRCRNWRAKGASIAFMTGPIV